jgi:hypothetical protein
VGWQYLALGGLSNNIRVMVGYKNDKAWAIATKASELINEFKM